MYTLDSEKQNLRKEMRQILAAVSRADHARYSAALRSRLIEHPRYVAAHTIYGFAPCFPEPDWIGNSLPPEKKWAFPRIDKGTMQFFLVEKIESLVSGTFGILTPPSNAQPAPSPDLILVPSLAFDRNGHRLGRGGGFYDRFLAQAPASAYRLALALPMQIRLLIPTAEHDCPVQEILVAVQ